MVGDALSDIQAGESAGIGQTVLVETGRGNAHLSLLTGQIRQPVWVFADLLGFASYLLESKPLPSVVKPPDWGSTSSRKTI